VTLNEVKQNLDQHYPRQFIAEPVTGGHDNVRIRRRAGPDFSDEDIVGFYNLMESTITWEMIAEDIDFFLQQAIQ